MRQIEEQVSAGNDIERIVLEWRLLRVGKEEGTIRCDSCGTFAGFGPVHPSIGWMKLKAMAEGARIASQKLWS